MMQHSVLVCAARIQPGSAALKRGTAALRESGRLASCASRQRSSSSSRVLFRPVCDRKAAQDGAPGSESQFHFAGMISRGVIRRRREDAELRCAKAIGRKKIDEAGYDPKFLVLRVVCGATSCGDLPAPTRGLFVTARLLQHCKVTPRSLLAASIPSSSPLRTTPESSFLASQSSRWYSSQGIGDRQHPDGPDRGDGRGERQSSCSDNPSLLSRMVESAATSFASILVLAVGFAIAGYVYHKSYKHLVLKKMENAFEPGDPVLELAAMAKGMPSPSFPGGHTGPEAEGATHWVQRPEQSMVDRIVAGREVGHYYLLIGEKGTGKSSMLLEAMRKIDGDGVAMFEAHADLEIFRIRLGKALDYEFHEDYIGGYFSERGPRDTTALLDIERALNKLEKVALRRRKKTPGRPLVVIINQMHLVRDDEDGKDLLELLQQRAEQWAASNLVTIVFNSDDYWVYEQFKQLATRMEVLSVQDLPKAQATAALQKYRRRYMKDAVPDDVAEKIYDLVGGRLSFLNRVAKSRDMLKTCEQIIDVEKTWFLNQCWILGADMDDDVMNQQKWASSAMVLALALVDKEAEMDKTYDPVQGHVLPSFPLHEAQEIMTRADFIRALDRQNLFSITSNAQVRASSVPMHTAFKEICSQERFRHHLEATIKRIADIESLGRTRELVAKDLVLGGHYEIEKVQGSYGSSPKFTVRAKDVPDPSISDSDDDKE